MRPVSLRRRHSSLGYLFRWALNGTLRRLWWLSGPVYPNGFTLVRVDSWCRYPMPLLQSQVHAFVRNDDEFC